MAASEWSEKKKMIITAAIGAAICLVEGLYLNSLWGDLKDLTKQQPIDVPIPSRTGYVQLPDELHDPDPLKAMEKQNAFAKRTKELAAPAKG